MRVTTHETKAQLEELVPIDVPKPKYNSLAHILYFLCFWFVYIMSMAASVRNKLYILMSNRLVTRKTQLLKDQWWIQFC